MHILPRDICDSHFDNGVRNRARAVARSENPRGLVVLGGENVPPLLVDIGLADLSKNGGALAPPAPSPRLRQPW